jgi:hypothetical protein
MMNKPNRAVVHMPAWLHSRYIALAQELERMHGAAFADAFLTDIGIVPHPEEPKGQRASVTCSY